MKKIFLLVAPALLLCSCRTNRLSEANTVASPVTQYQEVTSSTPASSSTYYSQPTSQPTIVSPVVKPGDKTESVVVVNPTDQGKLVAYNIVVGAFGVQDNAERFKNLMVSRGYTGAFLVKNQQGLYRVVAASTNDRAQAETVRNEIRTRFPNDDAATTPKAWILIPTF